MLQVDKLILERKEAQQAAQSDESTKRQKEADNNAYLSLMPLNLPAPPVANTSDFAGRVPHLQSPSLMGAEVAVVAPT